MAPDDPLDEANEQLDNAEAAGWPSINGPAPNKHGKFVAPLAQSTRLEDLFNEDGSIKVPDGGTPA